MLRLLGRNLTITTSTAAPTAPRFLHRPSFRTLLHTSPTANDPSLTLYFLRNSCGLSSEAAAAVAGKIHLKNTKKPHSVLALLRDYGFTKPQLARLVAARPHLLLADPHKTLKPKLDFYRGLGLSDPDLARLVSSNSVFLLWSLENRMIPNLDLLRAILHTNENVVAAVKNSPLLLLSDLPKVLLPKIEILRNHGMPDTMIAKLVGTHPRSLIEKSDGFEESFAVIQEMGISPSSSMFVHALGVLSRLPKPTWEKKLENYRSLGWSQEEVLRAFAKHPYCMSASVEKVRKNMEFFAEKLQWGPAYVSMNPPVLSLSFEKRIVPRYLVMRILASKGLAKGDVCAHHLVLGEKEFLKNYVIKYQGKAPEVVDAITGKMGLEVFETSEEEIDQKQQLDAV